MNELPKMKRYDPLCNITIRVEKDIEDLYREGRKNGWDVSEIARQALTETFRKLSKDLSRSAS